MKRILCGATCEDFSLRRNDKYCGYFAWASTSLSLTRRLQNNLKSKLKNLE
ncbi:hypothetical protein [Flavobacterium johnsoniae]|uniref:hypothetical protein n=1 Tax=Flavobacterium johnsoniae TaxID=986 RepID=UPI0013566A7C|nr:hypothetical protein [Flavobacterium johnsoniae]WQG83010.1 hypothetical protein SR927_07760 [Flavobacterium johnsoniae UW101]